MAHTFKLIMHITINLPQVPTYQYI